MRWTIRATQTMSGKSVNGGVGDLEHCYLKVYRTTATTHISWGRGTEIKYGQLNGPFLIYSFWNYETTNFRCTFEACLGDGT